MKRDCYRSVNFNDERKWKKKDTLDDLLQVGTKKAIGNMPNHESDSYHGKNHPEWSKEALSQLMHTLSQQGKLVDQREQFITLEKLRFMGMDQNPEKLKLIGKSLGSWTFHVGDRAMIASVINRHQDVLIGAGWQIDPDWVFNKICETDVRHHDNQELYHVICDLFNSWCLHCEEKDWSEATVNGSRSPLSVDPYDPDEEEEKEVA